MIHNANVTKCKCDKMQIGENANKICKYDKICAKVNLLYKHYVSFAFCYICIMYHLRHLRFVLIFYTVFYKETSQKTFKNVLSWYLKKLKSHPPIDFFLSNILHIFRILFIFIFYSWGPKYFVWLLIYVKVSSLKPNQLRISYKWKDVFE